MNTSKKRAKNVEKAMSEIIIYQEDNEVTNDYISTICEKHDVNKKLIRLIGDFTNKIKHHEK